IFDECMYEGNINSRWGNLSGEEMTRRFWLSVMAGTYGGHGETYLKDTEIDTEDAILWWAHGGELKGTSPERIRFLRALVEETAGGTGPIGFEAQQPDSYLAARRSQNEVLLWYFDFHQPLFYDFPLPEGQRFRAEWIDPWAMTRIKIEGTFSGKSRIKLTGKPYQAILFKKA